MLIQVLISYLGISTTVAVSQKSLRVRQFQKIFNESEIPKCKKIYDGNLDINVFKVIAY